MAALVAILRNTIKKDYQEILPSRTTFCLLTDLGKETYQDKEGV